MGTTRSRSTHKPPIAPQGNPSCRPRLNYCHRLITTCGESRGVNWVWQAMAAAIPWLYGQNNRQIENKKELKMEQKRSKIGQKIVNIIGKIWENRPNCLALFDLRQKLYKNYIKNLHKIY